MTTTADKIRALEPQAVPIPEETAWAVGVNHGHSVGWKHGIEAAAALVEAEPPQAVRVKPLVWGQFREGGCVGRPKEFQYFVTQQHNGRFFCHFDESSHDHLADAQAHCDQHYQRAALDLTPPPVDASPAPDPVSKTPTLDALAMRRAAIAMCRDVAENAISVPVGRAFKRMSENMVGLPMPSPADALREARQLPEVVALVEAAYATLDAIDKYNAKNGTHIIGGPPMRLAKALAALKGVK